MSGRKPKSAGEFMKELDADDGYQAAVAARDRELAKVEAELSRAERPLVRALADVGVAVDSVWDLVNTSDDYSRAVAVLEEHLQDAFYPDRVREGIARSLSVRAAASAWPTIITLYRSSTGSFDLQQGLAAALAGAVTEATIDELVDEARDPDHGESRLILLRGLKRLRSPAARTALEGLIEDPELAKTAKRLLAQ